MQDQALVPRIPLQCDCQLCVIPYGRLFCFSDFLDSVRVWRERRFWNPAGLGLNAALPSSAQAPYESPCAPVSSTAEWAKPPWVACQEGWRSGIYSTQPQQEMCSISIHKEQHNYKLKMPGEPSFSWGCWRIGHSRSAGRGGVFLQSGISIPCLVSGWDFLGLWFEEDSCWTV